jgi:myosin heavy subunit
MSSSSSSASAAVASTAATSVAALTHSFDFDLHLEGDKPKGQLLQGRSYVFVAAIILGMLSSLWYRNPGKTSAQTIQPLADIMIPNPVDIAKELNDRYKQTKDLNELIASRINILNDTVSSLRSRVLQIEKRPILTNPENFTATKIEINSKFVSLADQIKIQSEKFDNIAEVQMTTSSALKGLQTSLSSKVTQLPTAIKTVEDNLARLQSRVDKFSSMETEVRKANMESEAKKEKMLMEATSKAKTVATEARIESDAKKAKILTEASNAKTEAMKAKTEAIMAKTEAVKAKTAASKARIESEDMRKKLEAQSLLFAQNISKLEEKFASTLKNADKAFAHMRADLNLTAAAESNKWDGISVGNVSDSFLEGIVRNVWNENKEIYKSKLPDLACPKTVTVVSKIVEIIVEKEVEKKVLEAVVNAPAPDFARRKAGAKILPEGTSETFVHPDMNFKEFSKSFLKLFGVSSDSSIANNAIVSQISDIADSFAPAVVQILGLDSGIGRPEDAISSDMSLGSCWPMQVRTGTGTRTKSEGRRGLKCIRIGRTIIYIVHHAVCRD